jgi:thiamine kinase-like enzyme
MQGWKAVLAEHPGVFDEMVLEQIEQSVNDWNKKFFVKEYCFVHGDFHFENLLQDEDGNIKIIDWQNCGTGHGSGDISFLLSRLSADGFSIDAEKIIEMYCQGAKKQGRRILAQEIFVQMSLANLNTSFRFWHMYLHGSEEKRVRDIYEKMIKDAIFLQTH